MAEEKKNQEPTKQVVVNVNTVHNGTYYPAGSTVEMTETDIKAMEKSRLVHNLGVEPTSSIAKGSATPQTSTPPAQNTQHNRPPTGNTNQNDPDGSNL